MTDTETITSTLDLTGKWILNREQSDDSEEVLQLQNIGYLLRKAARYGSVTLVFDHDTKQVPHVLSVTIIPPGGFAKESRTRKIDGERVEDKHFMFGTNYVTWSGKKRAELEGYMAEEEWVGDDLFEEVIEEGKGSFTNYGIWGIVEKDGKKCLVKRATVTTKDGKSASIRQVFDYAPLDT